MAETETKEVEVKEAPAAKGPFADLRFDPPGTQRKIKNVYTVKALSPKGTLVQLPLADQINNNVAGSESLIGLLHYQNKGFNLLWDFEKNVGAYCPMGDCFAEWNDAHQGFCVPAHAASTTPRDNPGRFGRGATTSTNKWSR